MGSHRLRLRPLRLDDEAAFLAATAELAADGFGFGIGHEPGRPWPEHLVQIERERLGIGLPAGIVPMTYLVADVDGELVGRTSIRHELNEMLATVGGHIGYVVRPANRRKGYGTEILRQSLVIARSIGVDRVLVTCDDDNVGSAAVIEACGGVFESLVEPDDSTVPKRRYWID